MPFQSELASIRPLHEKAIFHQMTNASSSPNFRIADTPIQNMTVRRSQSIPID
jgi:hypothetical protein